MHDRAPSWISYHWQIMISLLPPPPPTPPFKSLLGDGDSSRLTLRETIYVTWRLLKLFRYVLAKFKPLHQCWDVLIVIAGLTALPFSQFYTWSDLYGNPTWSLFCHLQLFERIIASWYSLQSVSKSKKCAFYYCSWQRMFFTAPVNTFHKSCYCLTHPSQQQT